MAAESSLFTDPQPERGRPKAKKEEKVVRDFTRGELGEFLDGADADNVSDSGHEQDLSEIARLIKSNKELQEKQADLQERLELLLQRGLRVRNLEGILLELKKRKALGRNLN